MADHLNRHKERAITHRRHWVIVSALLLTLGVGLTFAGGVNLFFPNIIYEYKSDGVVLDGEPKEIFRNPTALVPRDAERAEVNRALDAINARVDESYLQSPMFRGTVFNIPVEGGSRTYYLQKQTEIDPWQNKAIVFLGIMMLIAGVIGLGYQDKAFG